MTTAVADPAAALAAAQAELWEQLRELVDGGPAEDLLERVRKLTASVGRKITRARKLAEPKPEPVAEKPSPAKAVAPEKPRAVPAVRPAPRATVRVPNTPTRVTPQQTRKRPPSRAISGSAGVRPRLLAEAWMSRTYLLAFVLLGIVGVVLAAATGSPLALGGAVIGVLTLVWRARRARTGFLPAD